MNKPFDYTNDKKLGLSNIVTIIIVVLALLAGGIGGYFYQKQKNENKSNTTTDDKNTIVESLVDPNIRLTSKNYTNWIYTFSFDMYRPISEYQITESTTNSSWSDAVLTIDFAEPTTAKAFQDANGYYMTSRIIIIPTSKWVGDKYYRVPAGQNPTEIVEATKIGVSGDYTVASLNVGMRDNPTDLNQSIIDGEKSNYTSFKTFTVGAL
ncbi:MAG: hypothetical protein ACD_58C00039G0005 [uncultured bacterium]|nr:MAG: hypothetical protein ACD_58C00039G0005 [uncultured bacterium]